MVRMPEFYTFDTLFSDLHMGNDRDYVRTLRLYGTVLVI